MRTIFTILSTTLVLVLFVMIVSGAVTAGVPAAPGLPTYIPGSGSGGGGGGGGGSYSPPKFVPYTKPVNTSDGTTIGRLDGKDFTRVEFEAQKNGTVNGMSYTLTITGELSTDPPAGSFVDIAFGNGDASGLPDGLGYGSIPGRVSVTMSPADGWAFTSGPKYALGISGDAVNTIDPASRLYISWTDGSQYQIRKLSPVISNGSLSLEFSPPGHDGKFTVYSSAVITPTPEPTVRPTPTISPTPAPQGGISPVLLAGFVGAMAVVAVMGFFVGMRFK